MRASAQLRKQTAACSLQPEGLLVSLEGMLGMGIGVNAAVRLPEEMQKERKTRVTGYEEGKGKSTSIQKMNEHALKERMYEAALDRGGTFKVQLNGVWVVSISTRRILNPT